jgi:hypothetical protein
MRLWRINEDFEGKAVGSLGERCYQDCEGLALWVVPSKEQRSRFPTQRIREINFLLSA